MGTNFQVANTGNTRIGTGAFDASAALTINSTSQGALFPRMTGIQRDAISSPADGLVIYNTDDSELNFYDGTMWQPISGGGGGVTYPLLADDGSLGAPSYAFSNDTDCGLLRVGANNIVMAINGVRNLVFHTVGTQFWPGGSFIGGVTGSGITLSSGHFFTDAGNPGSAASPAFQVGGTTSEKGLYEAGSHILGISTQSTERVRISSAALQTSTPIFIPDGSRNAPTLRFTSDNSGFYRAGSADIRFAVDVSGVGRDKLRMSATGAYLYDLSSNITYQFEAGAASFFAPFYPANTGAGSPGIGFFVNGDGGAQNGIYRISNASFGFSIGSTGRIAIESGTMRPVSDNAYALGSGSFRYNDIWGVTLHSGDIELDNHWKITEGDKVGHPEEGVMLLSPEGKKFKIHMTEVE